MIIVYETVFACKTLRAGAALGRPDRQGWHSPKGAFGKRADLTTRELLLSCGRLWPEELDPSCGQLGLLALPESLSDPDEVEAVTS